MCLCELARETTSARLHFCIQQMDKKLSFCILIGSLELLFRPPLGLDAAHLITHYDNIITDVWSNKANSWWTEHNVSNWSFLYASLLFTSMVLQSRWGSAWHAVKLLIWLGCWWSATDSLEELVGKGKQQSSELNRFYYALPEWTECLPLLEQGRWHRLESCHCTGTPILHILQTSPQRARCLLWCKTASPRRNHNTLYFLLCWLFAGGEPSEWRSWT